MDFKKIGNFNWIEMDLKESEFDTNKTNPFLSISIHFRLLDLKVTNYFSNALI